ncbi:hypothetical protein ACTHGU_12050 [Chitinophagaceae bacterium MMS25-I14]
MKKTIVFLGLITGLSSCYFDKAEKLYPASACDVSGVTYASTIAPIMAQNCTTSGCHDAATASGGYVLDSYSGVQAVASSGRLMGAVKHESGFSAMPQNANQLDACTINKLQTWVDAGAPNN